jgi:CRP/FNR family transcriptional regulator, cyclic AMP receptor protein
MELISRILDGSIPEGLRASLPPSRFFGARVTQDDKIARLEEVTLLAECSRKQLKAVAKITDVVEVPAGTVLARQGDPGNEFYLIMDGSARVELARRRGRLEPGHYFGEMSLLDGEPRSATVTASTDLRLLVVDRAQFWRLLNETPDLVRRILMVLSRRVRRLEQVGSAMLHRMKLT